ncbi:Periodic tryptophan protein 2-like protein [Armadillidium vulgare]|nr:Periodic tryptophan protein 2-like protein [Armadillidium vulgare]
MKFGYKFSNLLGTVYRSGDILFTKDGNTLICPVGNKISLYDLKNNKAITLPIEARFNYRSLALSPNGCILIAAQGDGELHFINLMFKNIIYRKRLNGKVKNITFSPCGKYFALSFCVQDPSCSRRVYDPFSMERVYPCSNKIVCICWSHDSRLLCYGSNDMSIHVVGICEVTRHGFLSMWTCSMKVEDLIVAKNLFKKKPDKPDSEDDVTATSSSYKPETRVMVVAFGSGDFLILDLSGDDITLYMSSISHSGHFNSMKVISYSPDGLYLVKIWSTESSFCFMTFEEHTAEVTGVVFTQSGKSIITCSLDGTVRAFDMIRYRNFKTLTSLKATQFSCVTVDSSGELVAAGGQDSHNIYLWSLQRGSLLEILGGHEGPIVSIQFSLRLGSSKLISTSWDKTVKVWDAIANTTAKETLPLFSDGTCVAFKPDGEQFAVATMNGHITMFNADTLRQEYCIEGKNDLGAWQEDTDKVHPNVNLKANYFSTISYSPNGEYIIGGGKSKYVCIYSIKDELLIKKFEITQNLSFDAMNKKIRRSNLTESGINLSLIESRVTRGKRKIPGASKGPLTERSFKPIIMVHGLAFSTTGRSWAACSTEGVLIYSLDDDWLFDPIMLETSNTPATVRKKLREKNYSMALMMACRLNINSLIVEVIESIPPNSVSIVVDSLSQVYVELLLKFLPEMLENSRHIGLYSHWTSSLVTKHGQTLKERAPLITPTLCALQKALTNHYDNLSKVCSHNEYMLTFLLSQATLRQKRLSIKEKKKVDSDDSEDEIKDFEMKEMANGDREESFNNITETSDEKSNLYSDDEMS